MVAKSLYDVAYTFGAPWDGEPREELVELVEAGTLNPAELPRAIDLGCGTGANAIFLAEHGFDVTGVDFSTVALKKARAKIGGRTGMPRFLRGDLTAESIPDLEGAFDLLVDYGTLDDLSKKPRAAMVRTIVRLARPGSRFLLWCFYGNRDTLPAFSFTAPSRFAAGLDFGEEAELFGHSFQIETLKVPPAGTHGFGCFLMTRRS